MDNNVAYSKVPNSTDAPDTEWSTHITDGINQALLQISGEVSNVEFKQIDVVVPDPWVQATQLNAWAGKGGHVYYMRHYDGTCQIRGFATGGAYVTAIFTLPLQLRPIRSVLVSTTAGSAFANFQINASNGNVTPIVGAGNIELGCRFMPTNNRPDPLPCFPVNIKTRFKTPPKAVVALSCKRVTQDGKSPQNSPGLPSWRFVNLKQGPTVQITNIVGLEYGIRQRILLAIVGGE